MRSFKTPTSCGIWNLRKILRWSDRLNDLNPKAVHAAGLCSAAAPFHIRHEALHSRHTPVKLSGKTAISFKGSVLICVHTCLCTCDLRLLPYNLQIRIRGTAPLTLHNLLGGRGGGACKKTRVLFSFFLLSHFRVRQSSRNSW